MGGEDAGMSSAGNGLDFFMTEYMMIGTDDAFSGLYSHSPNQLDEPRGSRDAAHQGG
jgi:hypothetical protein